MLHIFKPPFSQSSGSDILGVSTLKAFRVAGLDPQCADLWPDAIAGMFNSGRIPFGRTLFRKAIAPHFARRHLAPLGNGDTAWILGNMVPLDSNAEPESHLKKQGAKYIFHVMDNWFAQPFLREGVLRRCKLADCLIVPTPQLATTIQEEGITTPVLRLEEPIDVRRLQPLPVTCDLIDPTIVWCGNPNNVHHLNKTVGLLNRVHKEKPFILKIISNTRPQKGFGFAGKVLWLRYNYTNEAGLLAGARAGLAPLEDTPYNRCKGAYKIKTYLAAGVPVVASRVGYQENLLRSGNAGILVQDDSQWFDAILHLLKDDLAYRQMANCAREVAVSEYSHATLIPSWVKEINPHLA